MTDTWKYLAIRVAVVVGNSALVLVLLSVDRNSTQYDAPPEGVAVESFCVVSRDSEDVRAAVAATFIQVGDAELCHPSEMRLCGYYRQNEESTGHDPHLFRSQPCED